MTEKERYCCLALIGMRQRLEHYISEPEPAEIMLLTALDEINIILEHLQMEEKKTEEAMKYEIGDKVMVPAKIVGIHQRENWTSYDVEIMNGEPSYDSDGYFEKEYSFQGSAICKLEEA